MCYEWKSGTHNDPRSPKNPSAVWRKYGNKIFKILVNREHTNNKKHHKLTIAEKYSEALSLSQNVNKPLPCGTWWTSQIWTAELVERPSLVHHRRSLGQSPTCAAYTRGTCLLPLCSSCPCWCHTGYAADGMVHDTEPSSNNRYVARAEMS